MNKIDNGILGILGNPLDQSMSPLLHNYWIRQNKLTCSYNKFLLHNIKDIDKALKILNIIGLNITIPYKKLIIKYLDKVEKTALKLQAVNTVVNKNGSLIGYNTDTIGFLEGLKKFKNLENRLPGVIIGAGGAAEAVIYSLKDKGMKEIILMNRTQKKAEQLAGKYKDVVVKNWLDKNYINNAGIIVNTTSLGMIGYPSLPISLNNTSKRTKIYDIVYNPLETNFIKEAKKNNLEFVTGLEMFLEQAKESFNIWFKFKPKVNSYLLNRIKLKIKYQ